MLNNKNKKHPDKTSETLMAAYRAENLITERSNDDISNVN